MTAKFIFVTGGVVSGLGKGITAASLGRLLRSRGLKITMQKFDPYLNVDAGTMNPFQHGEVFVTDDGAETDLDLGHYERFINESLSQFSNVTSGRVYRDVIMREREGVYDGGTVQIIPSITNEIKSYIYKGKEDVDVANIEIGGTVGDIESEPFLEAIRQFSNEYGRENCAFIHVTLVPFLECSGEYKSKPTQHSIKELNKIGIQPDFIVLRSRERLPEGIRKKIALLCNIKEEYIIENTNLESLYFVPSLLHDQRFDELVVEKLHLGGHEPHLKSWQTMLDNIASLNKEVNIMLLGKYVDLHDAYLSVAEALVHGGYHYQTKVHIHWVEAETITPDNIADIFKGIDAVVVPGGFGSRGIEQMLFSIRYIRENRIPFLGICLGFQLAVIEFARDVLGYADANSLEFDPQTAHPVVAWLPEQEKVLLRGGTMRLGAYPCVIKEGTLAQQVYEGATTISERHRHRYEINNAYLEELENAGMVLSGKSPDGQVVEMAELAQSVHPYFIGGQFHPEFKSRPNHAHPLFAGLVCAALQYKQN